MTLLRDLLGRVTQRDYRTSANWPTGTIAESDTFAFDAAGRLTSAVSGRYANTTSYAYDEFGRPITETLAYGGNSWAIGTDYDALGRAFKETQPGGAVIERTFTTRGQLHQVKRDGTTIATRSYDDGGRLSQQVFANGLTETYAYRLDDQLLSITTPGVETRSYTYDANKNVTSETITGPLSGYGWSVPSGGRNAEDRLTAWNRADGNAARTWTLSPVGNWTATSLNGTSTSRTYGDVHQPLSIGGATLQYDRRGMLTRDQAGRAYAWDRRGLLASVDPDADGTAEVTYLYDALGRKVGRSEAGTTRITPQSGWRTVAEFATSAPTTAIESYAYGAYIDEPLQKVGTGGTVYYHHDRRFSVTALSDASGAVVERYAYSIHGTVGLFDGSGGSRSATALANVRMYTGVERDPTSGKDYLRNRWFEAEVGFTGRDPLGHLDGASTYFGYFADGRLDPSGLLDEKANRINSDPLTIRNLGRLACGIRSPDGTITVTSTPTNINAPDGFNSNKPIPITGTMISRGGPGPILPNGSLVIGTAHSGRLDIQLLSEQQSNTTIQYHDNVDSMSKILDIIDSCPDNSLPCLAVIGHGSSGGCVINNDRIDHFCSWMLSDESIDQIRQKLAPNAELHIYACSQFNVGGAADI